jgi:hypothetical protein
VIEAGLAVRPEERISPWRYKPLITEAMRGVVPQQTLMRQTKASATYEELVGVRTHRADLLALCEDSWLARLGLIDANALREMIRRPQPTYLQTGDLHPTVACEVWLRTLEASPELTRGIMLGLRDGVSVVETEDGMALLDEHSGEYFTLNLTGALVVRNLIDGTTPDYAVQELKRQLRRRRRQRQTRCRGTHLRAAGSEPARDAVAMSTPEAVVYDPRSMGVGHRIVVRVAVAIAQLLARQPPRRIRNVLACLGRGAKPATFAQAKAARDAVVAVGLACAGREGCLARSLATVVYYRLRGQRATWCVGARRLPPFAAHAWIEVDGLAVDEAYPPDYFRTFFTVP